MFIITRKKQLKSWDLNILAEKGAKSILTKPRICDILNLDINEHFRINYTKGLTNWLYITEDGLVERADGGKNHNKIGNSIAYAINHPESIIRYKESFSDEEKDFAFELINMFIRDKVSIKRCVSGALFLYIGENHYQINRDLFPSLRAGDLVELKPFLG